MATIGMYNEEGVNVDLYIPRKCHASNTLIPSFDYSSVQISIADIDANGTIIAGQTKTFCIAGFIRSQGASDHAINHLCIEHGIIRGKTGRQTKASKKKQAAARKRFAGKPKAKITKKGGKPQGKRGPRPEGKRGPRPEGQRGPRPEGQRGPRPEGKRAPRPAAQKQQ
jgi:small subunit ribosomal protein S21e